jgi:hypothetical protein
MKTYGGVEIEHHAFFPSPLDGGGLSASRSGCFTPRKEAAGNIWIGEPVWTRYGREKFLSAPTGNRIPASLYTDLAQLLICLVVPENTLGVSNEGHRRIKKKKKEGH